ncbi:hypothetical protein L218DRAFT_995141 [Marasmius fiardii PR-910]|nr:hypothetical protein L218DRAFT_995141 [Marasmius fiardii PR-910]
MGVLDIFLGGVLGGSWANTMFFALELTGIYRYFSRYPNDPIYLKLMVALALILDTLGTVISSAAVYLYTVTHWGDVSYLAKQDWPIPAFSVLTGLSALLVQSFLIHRYYALSRNIIVSLFLLSLSIIGCSGTLLLAATIVQHPFVTERHLTKTPIIMWIVGGACADVCIAIALIIQLKRVKTAFKSTQSLIQRLTVSAIQTGSATSVVAVIALVVYFSNTESNVSTGIAFSFGRLYTISMLGNLNARASNSNDSDDNSKDPAITLDETQNRIHVVRTAVVHTDDRSPNPGAAANSDDKLAELYDKPSQVV